MSPQSGVACSRVKVRTFVHLHQIDCKLEYSQDVLNANDIYRLNALTLLERTKSNLRNSKWRLTFLVFCSSAKIVSIMMSWTCWKTDLKQPKYCNARKIWVLPPTLGLVVLAFQALWPVLFFFQNVAYSIPSFASHM